MNYNWLSPTNLTRHSYLCFFHQNNISLRFLLFQTKLPFIFGHLEPHSLDPEDMCGGEYEWHRLFFKLFLSFSSEAYSITHLYRESQILPPNPTFLIWAQISPISQQRIKNQSSSVIVSSISSLRPLHTIFLFDLCSLVYQVQRDSQTTSHIVHRHDVLTRIHLEYYDIWVYTYIYIYVKDGDDDI